DNRTVLFARPDDAMRPWQVWRHTIGTPSSDDVLVFQEDDEHFYVTVDRSRTNRYIVVTTASKTTSEVWLVDADEPTAIPSLVDERRQGVEYEVEHQSGPFGDRLLILTNADDACDFKVMTTDVAAPDHDHWHELVPHRVGVRIENVEAFARHVVL